MNWFSSSLGRSLLVRERRQCRRLVPSGYYPSSLQVGCAALNFLDGVETERRFFIGEELMDDATMTTSVVADEAGADDDGDNNDDKLDDDNTQPIHRAIANPAAMPFADKTHNLIILPHTLDFCDDPHAVLREVQHILVPQGCVVITGFNPLSLWGVAHLFLRVTNRSPWHANFYRSGRVQDWLALLGFELVGAKMLGYQPPLQNEKWRRQWAFLEAVGARWFPGMGAVYVIVARKREIGMTVRGVNKIRWGQLLPGIAGRPAQPAMRNRHNQSASRNVG